MNIKPSLKLISHKKSKGLDIVDNMSFIASNDKLVLRLGNSLYTDLLCVVSINGVEYHYDMCPFEIVYLHDFPKSKEYDICVDFILGDITKVQYNTNSTFDYTIQTTNLVVKHTPNNIISNYRIKVKTYKKTRRLKKSK